MPTVNFCRNGFWILASIVPGAENTCCHLSKLERSQTFAVTKARKKAQWCSQRIILKSSVKLWFIFVSKLATCQREGLGSQCSWFPLTKSTKKALTCFVFISGRNEYLSQFSINCRHWSGFFVDNKQLYWYQKDLSNRFELQMLGYWKYKACL